MNEEEALDSEVSQVKSLPFQTGAKLDFDKLTQLNGITELTFDLEAYADDNGSLFGDLDKVRMS